MQSSNYFHFQY